MLLKRETLFFVNYYLQIERLQRLKTDYLSPLVGNPQQPKVHAYQECEQNTLSSENRKMLLCLPKK